MSTGQADLSNPPIETHSDNSRPVVLCLPEAGTFNTVHVVMTLNHKIISLLLHNCNYCFATVTNHNVNNPWGLQPTVALGVKQDFCFLVPCLQRALSIRKSYDEPPDWTDTLLQARQTPEAGWLAGVRSCHGSPNSDLLGQQLWKEFLNHYFGLWWAAKC